MSLRPYQESAVTAALHALARSGSALLQMPTGAGKTKAATEIIKRHGKTIWFVCHRQEIERQASRAFSAAGIDHGIVSPRAEAEYGKPVQIVSVATLAKRMADLPAPALVVWDECHHVAAKSWASIREALTDARHLGLTATPERLDGKGLKDWFAELIVGPSVSQLIGDGFLSPFRYFAPSDPDLTAARLQAGDYRKRDADAVMNTPVLIGDAVSEYKRNAAGKRAIAFCTSVEASQALAARFNAEGIPAAHVDGAMLDGARIAAIEALTAGKIKVLSNVEVFTEGFDLPGIDAAILMRPTKSPTLLLQMIGRALRVAPGKSEAIIMDHAGLHSDHGWFANDWAWSLDGSAAKARRRAGGRGPRRCPECKEVRAEREPICACGYEFPTGREVGEFDGLLTEIRDEVPEGCETQAEFARRHNVAPRTIKYWMSKGLPMCGFFVVSKVADDWCEKNRTPHRPPAGKVSLKSFAERHGRSGRSSTEFWIHKGLPSDGKYVDLRSGDEWIANNSHVLATKPESADGELLQRQCDFAKEHGLKPAQLSRWIRLGHIKRVGKLIDVKSASQFIARYYIHGRSTSRLALFLNPHGESQSDFAKRIGVSVGLPYYWIKSGLPYDSKLGIPIQAALEWVRDNRPDIVIPPEAWPADNDNAAGTKAA